MPDAETSVAASADAQVSAPDGGDTVESMLSQADSFLAEHGIGTAATTESTTDTGDATTARTATTPDDATPDQHADADGDGSVDQSEEAGTTDPKDSEADDPNASPEERQTRKERREARRRKDEADLDARVDARMAEREARKAKEAEEAEQTELQRTNVLDLVRDRVGTDEEYAEAEDKALEGDWEAIEKVKGWKANRQFLGKVVNHLEQIATHTAWAAIEADFKTGMSLEDVDGRAYAEARGVPAALKALRDSVASNVTKRLTAQHQAVVEEKDGAIAGLRAQLDARTAQAGARNAAPEAGGRPTQRVAFTPEYIRDMPLADFIQNEDEILAMIPDRPTRR